MLRDYFTDADADTAVKCKLPLLWAVCPPYITPVGNQKMIKVTIPESK